MVYSNALLAGVGLVLLGSKAFLMLLNFPKCCYVDIFSLVKETVSSPQQDPKDLGSSPLPILKGQNLKRFQLDQYS